MLQTWTWCWWTHSFSLCPKPFPHWVPRMLWGCWLLQQELNGGTTFHNALRTAQQWKYPLMLYSEEPEHDRLRMGAHVWRANTWGLLGSNSWKALLTVPLRIALRHMSASTSTKFNQGSWVFWFSHVPWAGTSSPLRSPHATDFSVCVCVCVYVWPPFPFCASLYDSQHTHTHTRTHTHARTFTHILHPCIVSPCQVELLWETQPSVTQPHCHIAQPQRDVARKKQAPCVHLDQQAADLWACIDMSILVVRRPWALYSVDAELCGIFW